MIKIFLVEDEVVIRNGIKNSINWAEEGYEFVGEASDGELAYPLILKEKPDILITDITMIIIGLAMGMIWECILFWLVYKILRKYCGGYHFSTSLKCYLSSCIMCPVVLAVVRYVPYSMTVWGLLTLTALIILSILSPVEAANKPLDEKEQRIFGITARILIIISAVCWSVTAIVFRQLILSKIISLSIISVAVFVIAGKMYLTVRKHN